MADISNWSYKKAETADSREFTIDSDMLKVLMALDGKKTVRQISREIQLTNAVFKSTFLKLIKLGLIEKTGDGQACVQKPFIDNMRQTLIQLVGPLGGVLVDDAAEELGWQAHRIPLARVADFVAAVAREIPSDKQSNEFKKRMIAEMRTQGL